MGLASVLCAGGFAYAAQVTTSKEVQHGEEKRVYVTVDIYSVKTGEYIRTDKNCPIIIDNSGMYGKLVYGRYKVLRSNKRGYNYYFSDGWGNYYFSM